MSTNTVQSDHGIDVVLTDDARLAVHFDEASDLTPAERVRVVEAAAAGALRALDRLAHPGWCLGGDDCMADSEHPDDRWHVSRSVVVATVLSGQLPLVSWLEQHVDGTSRVVVGHQALDVDQARLLVAGLVDLLGKADGQA